MGHGEGDWKEESQHYLLDQHVEVLGYFWCKAYHVEITPSVKDQAEAVIRRSAYMDEVLRPCHPFHAGCTVPLDLRIRRILLPAIYVSSVSWPLVAQRRSISPVTTLTCAIPCESLRTTPIWEGVAPFFASLQIWSTTCSGVVLSHAGGVREYGIALADIPLPLLWRRPMIERYAVDRRSLKSISVDVWMCARLSLKLVKRGSRFSKSKYLFNEFSTQAQLGHTVDMEQDRRWKKQCWLAN